MSKQAVVMGLLTMGAIGGWLYRDDVMHYLHPEDSTVSPVVLSTPFHQEDKASANPDKGAVYSWKDENGVTHFGSQSEKADAQRVILSKGNTVSLRQEKTIGAAKDSSSAYGKPVNGNMMSGSPAARQQAEMNAVSQGSM